MRKVIQFPQAENSNLLKKLIHLSSDYTDVCILNSNDYQHDTYSKYKWLAGFGQVDSLAIKINDEQVFEKLDDFLKQNKNEWVFGYLAYDLKNKIELLDSSNLDLLNFNTIYLFVPQFILTSAEEIELFAHQSIDNDAITSFINSIQQQKYNKPNFRKSSIQFKQRIQHDEYLQSISAIQQHIKLGDIYEMNFCQEFYSEQVIVNPADIFTQLNEVTPAPFSAFFKENDCYLMSASPERYIQKTENHIISQPIKGTAKRAKDILEDEKLKLSLENNSKERAENIMIVDLVRNDLSRIAKPKSVNVSELCGIYTFPQVHQMISTVTAELPKNTAFSKIIKATFPMGSMTGAPKIRAMELIEQFEKTQRGLFSGSVGYIDPHGDFDFNVVIRSLLYHAKNQYLSLSTGGAITFKSNAEEEYQESLLKAQAILGLFD